MEKTSPPLGVIPIDIRMTVIRKTEKNSLGRDMEKSGHLYMAGRHMTWNSLLGK